MKTITVDTNVLISATFWYGASYRIIKEVEEGRIILILSPQIIKEFAEVLDYEEIQEKIIHKNLEMKMTVAKIKELAVIVYPSEKVEVVKEDPDDNEIIECAIEGKADCLISQDKHLLEVKSYRGIAILTPEEFLNLHQKEQ